MIIGLIGVWVSEPLFLGLVLRLTGQSALAQQPSNVIEFVVRKSSSLGGVTVDDVQMILVRTAEIINSESKRLAKYGKQANRRTFPTVRFTLKGDLSETTPLEDAFLRNY